MTPAPAVRRRRSGPAEAAAAAKKEEEEEGGVERCLSRWRPAIGCPASACRLSGLTGAVVSRETRHLDGEIVSKCGRVGWRLGERRGKGERLSSSSMRTTVQPSLLLSSSPCLLYLCSLFSSKRLPLLVRSPSFLASISPPLRSSLLSLEWCEHHHSVCEMSFPLPAFRLPRWDITSALGSPLVTIPARLSFS